MASTETTPVKVVLLGNGGVGKTCLTLTYMYDEFVDAYEPTKSDIYRKDVNYNGKTYDLNILDTAGQEDYNHIRDSNIRQGQVFVLVFSLCDRESFEKCQDFREQIQRVKNSEDPPMILVGNKYDLVELDKTSRAVTRSESESRASQWKVKYIEASAKGKLNIDDIFLSCISFVAATAAKDVEPVLKNVKKKSKCSIL